MAHSSTSSPDPQSEDPSFPRRAGETAPSVAGSSSSRAARFAALDGPYALTDRRLAGGRDHAAIVAALLDGGVRVVQIREKYMRGTPEGERIERETGGRVKALAPERLRESLAECLRLTRRAGALLFVNDDPALAVETDADGAHVGQGDCPPRRARAILGPDRLLGLSTHTPEQFAAALDQPVDYVALGPVFGTVSKVSPYDARGLDFVARAAAEAERRGLPLVPIGGISLANLESLIAVAPRCRPAVVGAFMTEGDIAGRAREFLACLDAFRARHRSAPDPELR